MFQNRAPTNGAATELGCEDLCCLEQAIFFKFAICSLVLLGMSGVCHVAER